MTVTAVHKDPAALTMTVTAEFDASPERVWDLWADPRQLERWWGPPTYPATFTSHDLTPGFYVEYHMTGPSGDQPHAFWNVLEVDPPRRLVFESGLAHPDGTRNEGFPANVGSVKIEPIDAGRTRMSIESRYPTADAMAKFLAMGMEQGLTMAVGQIDDILAEGAVV
ncbi:MAG: SRPBCC domain-containing protein [Chloroflexota bacterium]